ncbi:hypothetical protein EHI8A_019170 [Entamoeba histolytica HM-1:IMSS-B]|uniref:Uncharacterized protein n=6 Tax=Entamoeba histolytica TaxID=5759 RepID=C4M9C7_ENTH1|nr:hypothetical protein EHI_149890 [Entamoeba histolytica HM-1:IMSS]EMD46784.1 Hypothetical protein EHI5A_044610 [Entamoeba histolytica KU27]EMH77257.1 hypothetical protein EHI8A_019170 [Entamoeba histolytica HM-1:IMSS-B]EMS16803.1 hypothetical protein KM1_044040 [Entamoeba histolytica HM-3:IMSS]ENY64295.1 hypothetical protein EHI7A_019140 [Entamoeba histolytica HM-1:IMSS-A]GAT98269.1 hypothetical protein CL6EHI_149890 [Entamoeba histolytica]|eukprot:XP_649792.1 hypothetical protein EHI_149890 [Entamoeba histolytica HM-1:IMSS]
MAKCRFFALEIREFTSYLNYRTLERLRIVNKRYFQITQKLLQVNVFDIDGKRFVNSLIESNTINILPTYTHPTSNHLFKNLNWVGSIFGNPTIIFDYSAVVSPSQMETIMQIKSAKQLEVVMDVDSVLGHKSRVEKIVNQFPQLKQLKLSIDPGEGNENQRDALQHLTKLVHLTSLQTFSYHHNFIYFNKLNYLNIFINDSIELDYFLNDIPQLITVQRLTLRTNNEFQLPHSSILQLTSLNSLEILNLSKCNFNFSSELVSLQSIYRIKKIFLSFDIHITNEIIDQLYLFPPIFIIQLSFTIDGNNEIPNRLLPPNVCISNATIQEVVQENDFITSVISKVDVLTTDIPNIPFSPNALIIILNHITDSRLLRFNNTNYLISVLLCGDLGDDSIHSLLTLKYLKKFKLFDGKISTLSFLSHFHLDTLAIVDCTYPINDFHYITEHTSLLVITLLVSHEYLTQEQNSKLMQMPFLQMLRTYYCSMSIDKKFHPFRIQY